MFDDAFKNRFIKRLRIIHEDLCWEWTGWKNEKGYGRLRYKGQHWFAHRAAYAMANKKVFEPLDIVMHLCNNPKCCNPAHLKLGTILENNQQKGAENRCYVRKRKSSRKRLKYEEVVMIKLRLRNGHGTWNLACDFGVSDQCIRDIKNGNTWRDVKLPTKEVFEYDPFADE